MARCAHQRSLPPASRSGAPSGTPSWPRARTQFCPRPWRPPRSPRPLRGLPPPRPRGGPDLLRPPRRLRQRPLLAATLGWLQEVGYDRTHLQALRDSAQARRFYAKSGFARPAPPCGCLLPQASGRRPRWPSLLASQVRRLTALAEDWTGGVGPAAGRRPCTPARQRVIKKNSTSNQDHKTKQKSNRSHQEDGTHQLHQLLTMTPQVKITYKDTKKARQRGQRYLPT